MLHRSLSQVWKACSFVFLLQVSAYAQDIDHAQVVQSLNLKTLQKGKLIYLKACSACHGMDGTSSLPQARSFSKDPLRFGNQPYEMWKTITNGAGMMASQNWLNPEERYYVIQYIREVFLKDKNPGQYFKITNAYLATLPKSQKTTQQQVSLVKKQALSGSLQYGQEWFMNQNSNYGHAIHSPLQGLGTSVLTIKLDNQVNLSYNLHRMGTLAAWQGKLNVSETKFKLYRGEGEPFVEGVELPGLDTWQWLYNNRLDSLKKATGIRAPLPPQFLKYNGHYAYGKEVVLSYAISGRSVLEHPQALYLQQKPVLVQTLVICPGSREELLCIGQLKDSAATYQEGIASLQGKFLTPDAGIEDKLLVSMTKLADGSEHCIASGIVAASPGISWRVDDLHRLLVTIPASKDTIKLQVYRFSGKEKAEIAQFGAFFKAQSSKKPQAGLDFMLHGANRVVKKTTVHGQLNVSRPHFDPMYYRDQDKTSPSKLVAIPADYPYAVDNIALPFDNPEMAWIRPTAIDFMSDGRLLMATYMGDLWMATGIDQELKNIGWQRFATGLYEPMGIKVINDEIFVTCRNGIVRLHDLNKNGEADFYELFYPDQDVSAFFHAFNFGLVTDSKGYFYYVKPGEYTDNKDPGNLIRVSPDGKTGESLATGFRVNNGITITPDDRIFVSDNQGNWIPANKINLVEKDKFYGYVPNLAQKEWSPNGVKFGPEEVSKGVIRPDLVKVPTSFSPPALWIPQEFDNSPGGGIWSDKSWGPLGDQFIHSSYGTGWLYQFFAHDCDGIPQGAMVALPFQFDAGIQRAIVNPVDKQLYTTGLTGWDDGVATQYGVLSRVRYKGGAGHLMTDAFVAKDGIVLKFNFKLDDAEVNNLSNYQLHQWNYHWTSTYGSAHYSLKNPEQKGEDAVVVQSANLGADQQSIFLQIPEMTTVNTLRIRLNTKAADGQKVSNTVYLTINKVPR